jgi:predicted amidohydrolase/ribosomal protein S18 acetylase RimI-like enzyme
METQDLKIELRNLQLSDYEDLLETANACYSEILVDRWEKSHISSLVQSFPEGQLCVTVNDKVVAVALSIIIDYGKFGDKHTYQSITGNETYSTHTKDGDTLYGIEVIVHPDYRGMRLARRLYDARKVLVENLNLRSILIGGRMSSFGEHAAQITPKEYLEKVKDNEIHDAVLHFQMSNDFHVRKVMRNYLPGDNESKDYAALMEWNNIYYEDEEKHINQTKSVVRIGLVQWQMRELTSFEALVNYIDYFIDAVSAYQSDFVLFPELFNAPLMQAYNDLGESQAIRQLASFTERLRDVFIEKAVSYNINIITGSMPYLREDSLYNISYLCRRDGSWDYYEKAHITPAEKDSWGMKGGDKVKVFETDAGRVGIVICYDVEFPELTRIYAEQGMQILFVPFLTDTQNGYMRVRTCAMARAIENECYVAIAGSVGNLPKVNNMDIQFAQSAVFTPSDFAFPTNCIKAEATPNAEMTIVADVDLDLLKELHNHGSVKTLADRRNDLYQINWKGK